MDNDNPVKNTILSKAIDSLPALGQKAAKLATVITSKAWIEFGGIYKKYRKHLFDKYSQINTFVFDNPQSLKHVFVDSNIGYATYDPKYKFITVSTESFLGEIIKQRRVLLIGSSGVGKSTLLKKTLFDILDNGLYPVFISVKDIRLEKSSLFEYIYKEFQVYNVHFSKEYLNDVLSSGCLVFLFDGFDEVLQSEEHPLVKAIDDFVTMFPDNDYVISSRKKTSLQAFNRFIKYSVLPLTLSQAKLHIRKSPIADVLKYSMIEEISPLFTKDYDDFFSNPLLLGIAIKTYNKYRKFPKHASEFYHWAFKIMYSEHDQTKPLKREFQSDLSYRTFLDLCSFIAYKTYLFNQISFSEERFYEVLEEKYPNVDHTSILHDMLLCICLLLNNDGELSFIHRSFQEYFVAVYLYKTTKDELYKFVMRRPETMETDIVYELMYVINPDKFVNEIIVPYLKNEIFDCANIYNKHHNQGLFIEKLVIQDDSYQEVYKIERQFLYITRPFRKAHYIPLSENYNLENGHLSKDDGIHKTIVESFNIFYQLALDTL